MPATADGAAQTGRGWQALARAELPLGLTLVTTVLFWTFGPSWLADLSSAAWTGGLSAWLFAVILVASFGVVRHADALAELAGEPLGTLVLTLSVISIEVMMVSAVMLTGADNPTLARDTMYAVVMLVLNGLVGLCLLLGGLRHREQAYNLRGANAFLAVIVPLAVLCLVLPRFTRASEGPTFSLGQEVFLIAICLGLYGVFLAVQTVRHQGDFVAVEEHAEDGAAHTAGGHAVLPGAVHGALLLAYLLPVVLLSKKLAIPMDHAIHRLGAPSALAGMLVALLVLSPEGMSAVRAARANRLQRAVNIGLGSAAATIGLTVPAVLAVSLYTGEPLALGLDAVEAVMLGLTLLVSMVTFSSGRTNVLQGAVHLVLFGAYVMLIFD